MKNTVKGDIIRNVTKSCTLRGVTAMILKLAKVENFKCIEDSNEFSVEQVTCLIGKNESGKTEGI